jgi:ParB family chromosome partitioning protein
VAKAELADMLDIRAAERVTTSISDTKSEADIAYDLMFGLTGRPSGAGAAADMGADTSGKAVPALPLDSLVPYANHPFKPYAEDKLKALARSIRENGLQQPVIARRINGEHYEILAGHNRAAAFRLNGETRIPAIIVNADDDQAAMIVTETNLRQRDKLLPSEKAFAYKLQLDAIKHQGKKLCADTGDGIENEDVKDADTTSAQFAQKFSRDIIAERFDTSKDDVQRHIRLTYLITELLQLVDDRKLALTAGVELSYLTDRQQRAAYRACIVEKAAHIDLKLAGHIRRWIECGGTLDTAKDMGKLLKQHKTHSIARRRGITIKRKTFEPYLEKIPDGVDLERLFAEFLRERYGDGVQGDKC